MYDLKHHVGLALWVMSPCFFLFSLLFQFQVTDDDTREGLMTVFALLSGLGFYLVTDLYWRILMLVYLLAITILGVIAIVAIGILRTTGG